MVIFFATGFEVAVADGVGVGVGSTTTSCVNFALMTGAENSKFLA